MTDGFWLGKKKFIYKHVTDVRQHLQKIHFSLTYLKHDGITVTIMKHRAKTVTQTEKPYVYMYNADRRFCHFIKAGIRVN